MARAASEDPGYDLRVEAGAPGRHLLHGVEELIAAKHAVLEEVAHPAAPSCSWTCTFPRCSRVSA